jgi:tetratricopeptide (TPR) repeat protein
LIDRFKRKSSEQKAIEAYNLGLKAKYEGNWIESLAQNQKADKIRPGDEATIWNLGIAATALGDWDEARRAWQAYGIEVNDGPGEVLWSEMKACVRANPNGAADVVWGMRIDPARIRIENVPLASSERRYGDILVNDGAEEGTRISNGREYPVFDELGIWKVSAHSTFEVELVMPNESAIETLQSMCRENGLWVEDWGTVRILCEACSRSTPGEHVCTNEPTGQNRYGFAAKSEGALQSVLKEWAEAEDGAEIGSITLAVAGLVG